MKILCIGDVVGTQGVDFLCRKLPNLKRELEVECCIVNGENSDKSGTGLTRHTAEDIFAHGADVITTGNHCFRRVDEEFFYENEFVLSPANYPSSDIKCGMCTVNFGRYKVDVFNISGVAFLEPLDNPFKTLDLLLKKSEAKFKILDFHAESTAEKKALAFYADGRLSALFGTHTHVPTADACILPKQTGYITDVGMTGPSNSVIGVEPSLAIKKQMYHTPVRFEASNNPCELNGVLFTLDNNTGLCTDVKQIIIK